MFYEIHDSHGAPQCGIEELRFADRYELDDYLDFNQELCERLENGYAVLIERDEPFYRLANDYGFDSVVLACELHDMYVDAIEYGYGAESTMGSWLEDMQRNGIFTYHR